MDPLMPNDPLWKVLGAAKPVAPRPSFVANVVREARQTPQEKGLVARVRAWLQDTPTAASRLTFAGVAASVALLAGVSVLLLKEDAAQDPQAVAMAQAAVDGTSAIAAETSVSEVELPPGSVTQWADMEQFDSLLAVYDASLLTDREINELLY